MHIWKERFRSLVMEIYVIFDLLWNKVCNKCYSKVLHLRTDRGHNIQASTTSSFTQNFIFVNILHLIIYWRWLWLHTKNNFSVVKDFYWFHQISSHLLKKLLIKNIFLCSVCISFLNTEYLWKNKAVYKCENFIFMCATTQCIYLNLVPNCSTKTCLSFIKIF